MLFVSIVSLTGLSEGSVKICQSELCRGQNIYMKNNIFYFLFVQLPVCCAQVVYSYE